MNNTSLLGKKWVYKKFNNDDLIFLKENFYLDEITSKLLSIRKIDKKDINLFLNPSIKSSLPDPSILKDMIKATNYTVELIQQKKNSVFLEIMMLMELHLRHYLVIILSLLIVHLKFSYLTEKKMVTVLHLKVLII